MSLNNFIEKLFTYTESSKYSYSISETQIQNNEKEIKTNKKVTKSLSENLNYLTVKYNQLINSDVNIRKFTLNSKGKQYNSAIIYIDGMIDSELINHYLLQPLMLKNQTNSTDSQETIIINKNDDVNMHTTKNPSVKDLIFNSLLPQNTISLEKDFSTIINKINNGFTCLIIDTLDEAFCIEAKGFKTRSISSPENEIVVRGSQEAFVENIRVNTSMIRRIVNNENLVIEQLNIGNITKTIVSFCYMKNIANEDLVNEVRYRLSNLEIDALITSGSLEQLIQDDSSILFPQLFATERADRACNNLLNGRVVILVNGSPYALIAPAVLVDFISSPEDTNLKHQYGNLIRFIRCIAFIVAMFLPSIYVATTNFHPELLPTDLVFAISSMRKSIPFPVIVEILVMEISFELIREASLRVPSPLGSTIGIIGGLILGEAAVSANLVSPLLIIIVAITGTCSYAIPDFSLNFTIRTFRFIYIILAFVSGFLGISFGLFIQLILLSNLKSFGVSYFSPYIPYGNKNTDSTFYIRPIWKREKRSNFLNTKKPNQEAKISMKWKK